MKKFMLFSGILLLTILWGNQNSIAQESDVPELATGNYLTIGAFQVQENAIKLKEYINANGQYEAKIGYLPTTDYTYVYIRTYDDPQHGYPDVWDIRISTQFKDTWVFAVENELFQNNISQEQNLSSEFKYYLTIGAFAIKNNAVNFLSYVQQKNLYDVHVVYSPTTEYFYVYVDTFPTFKLGSPSVFEYRDQTEFYDTWLFGFHDSDLVQEEMIIDEFVAQNKRNNNTQVIGGSQATPFSPDLITSAEEVDRIQAGDLELAITFKALREDDGLTDDEILQQYAGEENAELSLDLSYLYAEGSILTSLAAEEDNQDVSYDRLAEVANMVSVVMKKHTNLTLAHEEEIYVFLTEEIGQFINDESDLVRLVAIAINNASFNEDLRLDLQEIVSEGNFHLANTSKDALMQANIDLIEAPIVLTTDIELAAIFKQLREEDGLTDNEILEQHTDEVNAELSLDLSYLNPEGSIIQNLASSEDADIAYNRLVEVADMVSTVIKKYPNLTLAHEEEMYVFLTEEIGQYINDENDLIRLVDMAVNRTNFSEELPLDLQKIVSKGNFHLADANNDGLMQANIDVTEVYRIKKSDIELAATFNQLREEDGLTDNYILQRYAEEENAELILELSYLNTDGSIIKGFAAEENSDMPYDRLSEIANMVSGVMRKYPNLTLEHEEEMYVFLSEEIGQYIDDSNDLLRLVNKAVNRTDFNEEEPLDLQEIIAKGNFHLADTGADDVMQANIDIIEIPRVLTSEFELASIFKQLREEGGLTDGEILNQHADKNNAELSLGLSYLNPEGSAIENLASPENIDVPYNRLYEIAGMISVVMKKHPNLTPEHEEEMYVFLTEEIGQYMYEEDDMIRLVDRVVNKKSFDVELPLDLQEVGSKGNFHLADMVEDKQMQKNLDDIVVEKVLVSDIELAQVFRQLRTEDGLSDKEILLQHTEAKNVKFILKLSYLNPEGTTINNFKSLVNLDISYRRLVAVAEMISEVRKGYPDLTVEHEEEIYTFLTKQIGQFIFDGNDLLELVDIAVNLKEYDVELPLDLEAIVLQGDYHLTDAVADSVMQANAELVEVEVIPRTYVDKDGRYKMYFYTFFSTTYRRIKGNIEVIDPVRLKQMSIEKANKRTTIPDPNNQSESIEVIANIFGYKKVQHDFKMSEPFDSLAANFLHFKGDVLMVDFPLTRYETGDVGTMFNVYFYKDAAVMKSDSKYELKELLVMLQENLNYRIKIHGHTNGNAPGKIIKLEEGATNFFSLEGTKEGFGSSKELSLQRAELIKSYLVENGVDADRMEVKGWGGKKSIYDKFDRRALKNVRVEIEITAD